MKVISFVNQKGGVAKTTSTLTLAEGLTMQGYKVLVIDLDGQANLSLALGSTTNGATILEVITGGTSLDKVIQHTNIADIAPAKQKLTFADALIERPYNWLKDSIDSLNAKYDYVLLDLPPAICARTVSALIASDYVVVPTRADLFSLQGLDELVNTILKTKNEHNPKLEVAGILLVAYKEKTALHRDILQPLTKLAEDLDTSLFNTRIRDSIVVSETPFAHKGLFTYAPKSKVAQDYKCFMEELLERTK